MSEFDSPNEDDFLEIFNSQTDEIRDLCNEDKEMMKLWNTYYRKKQQTQRKKHHLNCMRELIPRYLNEFMTQNSAVLKNKLYPNFVLHMITLNHFGLVDQQLINQLLRKLNNLPTDIP